MAAMEGFKRLFGSQNSTLRLLRNYGLSAINGLGAIKNKLIKQAMGFNISTFDSTEVLVLLVLS